MFSSSSNLTGLNLGSNNSNTADNYEYDYRPSSSSSSRPKKLHGSLTGLKSATQTAAESEEQYYSDDFLQSPEMSALKSESKKLGLSPVKTSDTVFDPELGREVPKGGAIIGPTYQTTVNSSVSGSAMAMPTTFNFKFPGQSNTVNSSTNNFNTGPVLSSSSTGTSNMSNFHPPKFNFGQTSLNFGTTSMSLSTSNLNQKIGIAKNFEGDHKTMAEEDENTADGGGGGGVEVAVTDETGAAETVAVPEDSKNTGENTIDNKPIESQSQDNDVKPEPAAESTDNTEQMPPSKDIEAEESKTEDNDPAPIPVAPVVTEETNNAADLSVTTNENQTVSGPPGPQAESSDQQVYSNNNVVEDDPNDLVLPPEIQHNLDQYSLNDDNLFSIQNLALDGFQNDHDDQNLDITNDPHEISKFCDRGLTIDKKYLKNVETVPETARNNFVLASRLFSEGDFVGAKTLFDDVYYEVSSMRMGKMTWSEKAIPNPDSTGKKEVSDESKESDEKEDNTNDDNTVTLKQQQESLYSESAIVKAESEEVQERRLPMFDLTETSNEIEDGMRILIQKYQVHRGYVTPIIKDLVMHTQFWEQGFRLFFRGEYEDALLLFGYGCSGMFNSVDDCLDFLDGIESNDLYAVKTILPFLIMPSKVGSQHSNTGGNSNPGSVVQRSSVPFGGSIVDMSSAGSTNTTNNTKDTSSNSNHTRTSRPDRENRGRSNDRSESNMQRGHSNDRNSSDRNSNHTNTGNTGSQGTGSSNIVAPTFTSQLRNVMKKPQTNNTHLAACHALNRLSIVPDNREELMLLPTAILLLQTVKKEMKSIDLQISAWSTLKYLAMGYPDEIRAMMLQKQDWNRVVLESSPFDDGLYFIYDLLLYHDTSDRNEEFLVEIIQFLNVIMRPLEPGQFNQRSDLCNGLLEFSLTCLSTESNIQNLRLIKNISQLTRLIVTKWNLRPIDTSSSTSDGISTSQYQFEVDATSNEDGGDNQNNESEQDENAIVIMVCRRLCDVIDRFIGHDQSWLFVNDNLDEGSGGRNSGNTHGNNPDGFQYEDDSDNEDNYSQDGHGHGNYHGHKPHAPMISVFDANHMMPNLSTNLNQQQAVGIRKSRKKLLQEKTNAENRLDAMCKVECGLSLLDTFLSVLESNDEIGTEEIMYSVSMRACVGTTCEAVRFFSTRERHTMFALQAMGRIPAELLIQDEARCNILKLLCSDVLKSSPFGNNGSICFAICRILKKMDSPHLTAQMTKYSMLQRYLEIMRANTSDIVLLAELLHCLQALIFGGENRILLFVRYKGLATLCHLLTKQEVLLIGLVRLQIESRFNTSNI